MGDPRSFPCRRGGWEKLLAEKGATQAPNPQIDAPRLARGHADRRGADGTVRAGSISLRLYPHNDLTATGIVDELRAQAALAVEHGFDGVMTSEHHGGFHGYLPNPLQVVGLVPRGDAARAGRRPCPLLLPLRPPALVAEEIAWLAARFPGPRRRRRRVGGAARRLRDHARADGRPRRAFHGRLRGAGRDAQRHRPRQARRRSRDRRMRRAPGPDAERGHGLHRGARAPARLGAGILFDSLSTVERCARAHRRVPRGRRHRPVRPDPAGVGRRAAARAARRTSSTCTAAIAATAAMQHWSGDECVGEPTRRRSSTGSSTCCDRTGRRRAEPARARARRHARGRRASRSCAWATRCCPASRAAIGSDRSTSMTPSHLPLRRGRMARPVAPGTDPEAAAAAGRAGAPPAGFLAQGDGGFYTQVVRMPPGFDAPCTRHDH